MAELSYRPAPFWFLNNKLERAEIEKQLHLMKEAGVSGFFMHPRAGLRTPYMSKEWFDMIEFIVGEAEKLGLNAWLYDEDPFPSGVVGGKVFFEHPEFAARGIKFYETVPDKFGKAEISLGCGRVLSAVALCVDADGKIVKELDIRDRIGVLRSDFFMCEWNNSYYAQIHDTKDFSHYRGETFYPHLQLSMDFSKGNWRIYVTVAEVSQEGKYRFHVDNLNRDCVAYFIKNTHEKYKERVGDKFGSVIHGIFTDEPSVGFPVPWTGKLAAVFEQIHGYSICNKYHHLFKNIDCQSRKFRKDYWEIVYKLFAENYFGQINDWCVANSLKSCGHCIGEEDPLATVGGSNTYGLQKEIGIPGFDHITNNIPGGSFTSLNLGGKLISSAALQQGKAQVLSECFACNPFNFGPAGMRKVANWLFSLGINWLVPHGFFYSYDGYRKFDAGRSFFFQHEDFKEFKSFADYAECIGGKLGRAKSFNHVCVLLPVSVFRQLLPGEEKLAEKIRAHLFDCVQFLLDQQVQFDLADEETLMKSELENGAIQCGEQRYDRIILVDFENVRSNEVAAVVAKFRSAVSVIKYPEETLQLPALAGVAELSVKNNSLMAMVKQNADGNLLYVFNNQAAPQVLQVKSKKSCAGCYFLCLNTGDYSEIKQDNGEYSFAVGGFDAAIIEFRKKTLGCPIYKMPENLPVKEYEYEKNALWDYNPPGEGWVAAVHRWTIEISGNGIYKSGQKNRFCLARDLMGTEHPYAKKEWARPIFDIALDVPSVFPVTMTFSADFIVSKEDCDSKLQLVFEKDTFAGDCQVFINGKEVDQTQINGQKIYDVMNQVVAICGYCCPGSNSIRLLWKKAKEFDGLRSSVYIKKRNELLY
ncbi:MAG: glycosyl hydrolase [Lentisphaeria bacterium]